MNYDLICQAIVERGKTRIKVKGDNLHRHRIKPGREGGTYDEYNVTILTRKEHRIVHKIRYLLYGKRHDLAAFTYLGGSPTTSWNKGIPRDRVSIEKQKVSIKLSLENRNIWNKGVPCSDSTQIKLSKSLKGREGGYSGRAHSQDVKDKIRAKLKDRKLETVTCPYCSKTGAKPVMNRFHFERCKSK